MVGRGRKRRGEKEIRETEAGKQGQEMKRDRKRQMQEEERHRWIQRWKGGKKDKERKVTYTVERKRGIQ